MAEGTDTEARKAAEHLAADLREAREVLKAIPDRQKREQLELILNRAQSRTASIQGASSAMKEPRELRVVTNKEPLELRVVIKKEPVELRLVTKEEYDRIMNAMKSLPSSNAELQFIKDLCKDMIITSQRFTCDQVREMFLDWAQHHGNGRDSYGRGWAEHQAVAAEAIRPLVIDPENFFTVRGVFTSYESDIP